MQQVNQNTYTYFDGEKIELEKTPNTFIVRAHPEQMHALNCVPQEQLSSVSWRVCSTEATLDSDMDRVRAEDIVAHHEYVRADNGQNFFVSDRIIVSFTDHPTEADITALIQTHALELVCPLTDTDVLFRLTTSTGMNPVKLVTKLTEDIPNNIRFVNLDVNYVFTTSGLLANGDNNEKCTSVSDPAFERQWHLHTLFTGSNVDHRSSSRCLDAWNLLGHRGSSDIVVGITDDGCRLDHRDFDGPAKFANWAYMRGSTLVHRDSTDADPTAMHIPGANHGTACAGVAAAEADGILTVGAAPSASLLPIKWESQGSRLLVSSSKLLTVLNFVEGKVDILSNSWGSAPDNLWPASVTERIAKLSVSGGRRGKGILFLWAAGNSNCPISHDGDVDIPYTSGLSRRNGHLIWVGVQTSRSFRNSLAETPGVMHVGALASTAQRSHYSNYGHGLSICAPSNNLHLYRRLVVPGRGITTAYGPEHGLDKSTEVTDAFGGTSSATPLVAGIAALALSANPDLTAHELQHLLQETASQDLSFSAYSRTPSASYDPNPDWDVSPVVPHDSGEFNDDGWSPWFGYGKVDALEAVAQALELAAENESTADSGLEEPEVILHRISCALDTIGDELDYEEPEVLADDEQIVMPPSRNSSVTHTLTLLFEDGTSAAGITVNASSRPVTLTSASWRNIDSLASRWPHRSAQILRQRHKDGIVRTRAQLDRISAVTDRNGQAKFVVRAWHVCGEETVPATDRIAYSWSGGRKEVDVSCGVVGIETVPHDENQGVHVKAARRGRRYLHKVVNKALLAVGAAWRKTGGKPAGMPNYFVITDASLRWGGLIPPHLTHRFGAAVDIRPISSDGKPTSVGAKNYSKEGTRVLISYLSQTGATAIIFGEKLPGVTRVKASHRNHIHVSWLAQPKEPWFAETASDGVMTVSFRQQA